MARIDIFGYFEEFYNRAWLHTQLDSISQENSVKTSPWEQKISLRASPLNFDETYLPQAGKRGLSHSNSLQIQWSWPAIFRQLLYLKLLTLPADADIPSVRDNPAHYADGFHCNVRLPLQGYAMPFSHPFSAWTRCSLPSSFSRTVLPYRYSEGYWLPLCRVPDLTLWRMR